MTPMSQHEDKLQIIFNYFEIAFHMLYTNHSQLEQNGTYILIYILKLDWVFHRCILLNYSNKILIVIIDPEAPKIPDIIAKKFLVQRIAKFAKLFQK